MAGDASAQGSAGAGGAEGAHDAILVRLLGAPIVESARGAWSLVAERPCQLLIYLAAQGDWVARDRLAALFWPEQRNDEARRNLRRILHAARREPLPVAIEQRGDLLRWPVATDLADLESALRDGRQRDARALLRGAFAAGMDAPECAGFQAWLNEQRHRIDARVRPPPTTAAPAPTDEPPASPADDEAALLAAVDRAWQRCTPQDRDVLACLSVMPPGFVLEAARAIASASLATLANLVDASLLAVTHDGGASRFTLHRRVRILACEQLDAQPALRERAMARYAAYQSHRSDSL